MKTTQKPLYQTHNQKQINGNTEFWGIIRISYNELVSLFGFPHESDGDKSDAEWRVETDNGEVFDIFNWKDGKNYKGKDGLNVEDIKEWHINTHRKCNIVSFLAKLFPEGTKLMIMRKEGFETIELTPTF